MTFLNYSADMNLELLKESNASDIQRLLELKNTSRNLVSIDHSDNLLLELIINENPQIKRNDETIASLFEEKKREYETFKKFIWIYYPWKNTIIKMVCKEDFRFLRTVRNRYKIKPQDQETLFRKKIGVIGLSVGHAVVMNLIQESLCEEIRIADFDTLDLSNLNRIRTSVTNLGVKKSIITEREVLELDPFVIVRRFDEGINEENIEDFMLRNGKLDLIIEECDEISIKFLVREKAKSFQIPLVMETSDRGMLDIERYDIDKDYPIFHGKVPGNVDYSEIKLLKTSEEKLPIVAQILDLKNLSPAFKASGIEVGKSISTWPQLGSDVNLGGAICAFAARKILLNQNINSGRSYVDLDLIVNKGAELTDQIRIEEGELDISEIDKKNLEKHYSEGAHIDYAQLIEIIDDACKASSPGNMQKWKWIYFKTNLFVFLDKERATGFADNFNFGSLIGIGCALENLRISALKRNLSPEVLIIESKDDLQKPIARIKFTPLDSKLEKDITLYPQIRRRQTNRIITEKTNLSDSFLNLTKKYGNSSLAHSLILDSNKIESLTSLICAADILRMKNRFGHNDFFQNEIRWSKEEATEKKDGLDINHFHLTELQRTGLELSKDSEAIRIINEINGGSRFEDLTKAYMTDAAAIGIFSIKEYTNKALIDAGIAIQNIWLHAAELDYSFQPFTSLQMLFTRLERNENDYLNKYELEAVSILKSKFHQIINLENDWKSVFLYKLNGKCQYTDYSQRISTEEKLKLKND